MASLESDFVKAMNDVRAGLSIRKAAENWGIKRTTLQDRVSGQIQIGRRRGPPPILTKQEESQFGDWLIELANRGFGDSFEAFLIAKYLANKPAQIRNCNETGFDMQGRTGSVLGSADKKEAPYRVLPGSREHVTALPCFNVCGQWIPPFFLFPGKRVPVTHNPVEGVFSPGGGYMDTFALCGLRTTLFQIHQRQGLFFSGHESHLNVEKELVQ